MKRKKGIWLSLGVVLACQFNLMAQRSTDPENLGSSYPKTDVALHNPVAYPSIREADVAYCKRIERLIDVREKKNDVMNWPRNPLNMIIHDFLTTGESSFPGKLKAYKNDSLISALTINQVNAIGSDTETIQIYVGPGPYDTKDSTIVNTLDYAKITRWEIVEDWIFDKQRSEFFPRIIAIAPMYNPSYNGILMPEQPMYYISWAQVRPLLAKEEIFNPDNEVRMSYSDFFDQRLFTSHITKESNSMDLAIKDMPEYKTSPMEALYESERIKNTLLEKEDDMWEH